MPPKPLGFTSYGSCGPRRVPGLRQSCHPNREIREYSLARRSFSGPSRQASIQLAALRDRSASLSGRSGPSGACLGCRPAGTTKSALFPATRRPTFSSPSCCRTCGHGLMPGLYRPRAYDSYGFDKEPRPAPQTSGGAGLKSSSATIIWSRTGQAATMARPLTRWHWLWLATAVVYLVVHSSVVGVGVADRGGRALSLGLVAVGSHRGRRVGVGHPPGPALRPWVGGRVGTTQPLRVPAPAPSLAAHRMEATCRRGFRS